jgi:hypothetical protein
MVGSWEDYSGWATEVKFEMTSDSHMTQSFIFNDREITQTYVRM